MNFAVSRSGGGHVRTLTRTFPSAASFCVRRIPALTPVAGRESHACCLPLCAGSKLNIHPVHPERPALSSTAEGAPRRPIRVVGPAEACRADQCLRAAGSRATPSTAGDDSGLISYLLFVNVLFVSVAYVELFVCRRVYSGFVFYVVSCRTSE